MNVTPRLERAISVATIAHKDEVRKGTDIPYIMHPFSVMCLASEVTDEEDVLIACLFHDILEDVPFEYPKNRMLEEFGVDVVSIVEGVTKDSSFEDWRERAEAYLKHLRTAGEQSLIVSAADKVHNLGSILNDYMVVGDELWERFNAGKEDQQWWYKAVLEVLNDRITYNPLTLRLAELCKELEVL